MPSLDELPALNTISNLSSDDLFPVLDVTGAGSSRLRKVTLQALTQDIGANNAGFGSVDTLNVSSSAAAFTHTINKAMTFVKGTFTGADGVATLTLPSVGTNNTKSVTISAAFNSQTGTAALEVKSPTASTLLTPANGAAVSSVILPIDFVYQFKTDGTNWYRVS